MISTTVLVVILVMTGLATLVLRPRLIDESPYAYGASVLLLWTFVVWMHYGPAFTLFGCTFATREGWMMLPTPIRWFLSFAGAAKPLFGQWANMLDMLRTPPMKTIPGISDFAIQYLVSFIPLLMALVYLTAVSIRVDSFGPSDPVSGLACRAISSVFSRS